MMCKKCSTSVADEDNFCKVCGKRLKGNDRLKKIIAILVILLAIGACAAYIFLNRGKGKDSGDLNDPPISSPLPDDTNIPENTETPAPTPVPTATADFSKDLDEVLNILSKSYIAVAEFMEDYSYTPFVSNKGYLFDVSANRVVKVVDLTASEKLDEKYEEEKVFFLYLRPADFAEYAEVDFDDSEELVVFSAYETKTGVALYSRKYGGIVYRENLNKILAMYGVNDGKCTRPLSTEQRYDEILEAVFSFDPTYGQFDVRYMMADDKYAITVLSPKDDSAKLLGYVLEKTGDGYRVIDANFEKYDKPIVNVNAKTPYMNIELMPKFSLSKTKLLPSSNFTNIAEILREKGDVLDKDFPVSFVSGTSDYLYLVFDSGVKFFGTYKADTGWHITRVDNWISAEIMLNMAETDPPTYILKQE